VGGGVGWCVVVSGWVGSGFLGGEFVFVVCVWGGGGVGVGVSVDRGERDR